MAIRSKSRKSVVTETLAGLTSPDSMFEQLPNRSLLGLSSLSIALPMKIQSTDTPISWGLNSEHVESTLKLVDRLS